MFKSTHKKQYRRVSTVLFGRVHRLRFRHNLKGLVK